MNNRIGISGWYSLKLDIKDKFVIKYDLYNDRFKNDCCFMESDDYIIAIEGCILNLKELSRSYKKEELCEIIQIIWETEKDAIIKRIKGTYVLVIYDKREDCIFISNDLLSKRPLYYYLSDDLLVFSSKYFELIDIVKRNNKTLSLNKIAIGMMLTKGYLGDNVTYTNEIKYIRAFEYIKVERNKCCISQFESDKSIITSNENEIIENLDFLFGNAVNEQFQKNIEYGYSQLCTLSAGMDSRMCLLYAHKLGYKDILCMTYAQSESVDYFISKQIAFDYKYNYLFYPLDSAEFLKDVNILSRQNECQQIYAGATGAYRMVNYLDTSNYGIIHTGSLGGELMSDIFRIPGYSKVIYENSALKSLPLWDKETDSKYKKVKDKYKSEEEYLLFESLRTTQNFFRMVDYKCEAFSPFMDEDFFLYVNRIPPELRYKRRLYSNWMQKNVPNDYITTYFRTKVGESDLKVFISKAINKIVRMVNKKSKFDMNPMEYWGEKVLGLSDSLSEIYGTYTKYLDELPDDIKESVYIKNNEGIQGRTAALTVMEALKRVRVKE